MGKHGPGGVLKNQDDIETEGKSVAAALLAWAVLLGITLACLVYWGVFS